MDERLEALERLAVLRDRNLLSDAEFEAEKARIFSADGNKTSLSDPKPVKLPNRKLHFLLGAILVVAAIGAGVLVSRETGVDEPETEETAEPQTASSNQDSGGNSPVRLSAILRFENAKECRPADDLGTLLSDMRSLSPDDKSGPITLGVDGPEVRPVVQEVTSGNGNAAIIAQLVAPSTWEGLRVTELRTSRYADSDIESFQIRFKETPDKVRRKLNEAGFDLPETGKLATIERADGHTLMVGIERVQGTTSLLCSTS
ncbi:MAG: SHOCT domain-containing protein [Novosphingobium sp.]|nr:SHOCT domain-containing protein [Novosphingobium sp.]